MPGSTYLRWAYCPACKGFGFLMADGAIITIPMRLKHAWKTVFMPMAVILSGFTAACAALAIFRIICFPFCCARQARLMKY